MDKEEADTKNKYRPSLRYLQCSARSTTLVVRNKTTGFGKRNNQIKVQKKKEKKRKHYIKKNLSRIDDNVGTFKHLWKTNLNTSWIWIKKNYSRAARNRLARNLGCLSFPQGIPHTWIFILKYSYPGFPRPRLDSLVLDNRGLQILGVLRLALCASSLHYLFYLWPSMGCILPDQA